MWIYVGKSNIDMEEMLFLLFFFFILSFFVVPYTRTNCMGIIVFPI